MGGVFAANMTGNTVLAGIALAERRYPDAGRHLAPLVAIIATPELKAQLAQLGAEPVGSSSAAFAAFMRAEHERWGRIIRERGIKPE